MFTSLREWRPPLRRGGRARPPKQRAGPVAAVPPAAAGGRPPDAAGPSCIPVTGPPIDTRNAQKVASILHFFKNFFVPRGDEDEIKEKADGGLPG